MAMNWIGRQLSDSNAAPVIIVVAVVLALTTVVCAADTLAAHSSARTRLATGFDHTSGRVQIARAVNARHSRVSIAKSIANNPPDVAHAAIETPRECDLHKGIDSACTFN